MYVLITGSRTFPANGFISETLDAAHAKEPIQHLVLGDCPTGADQLATIWARENQVSHTILKADWTKHGRAAGPIRNTEMVATLVALHEVVPTVPVYCIGFVDKPVSSSRGTMNCLRQCFDDIGFPVYYYRPNGEHILNIMRA